MSKNPTPVHLGMYNEFKSDTGFKTVNFRNGTSERTGTTSIEIFNAERMIADIHIDAKDNVAMALSILGVGRVTDEVERSAQNRADLILSENSDISKENTLERAVINLRAILIAQERKANADKELAEQAYALYTLSYPKTIITFEEFVGASIGKFWADNLKKIRKDPTVLGSL